MTKKSNMEEDLEKTAEKYADILIALVALQKEITKNPKFDSENMLLVVKKSGEILMKRGMFEAVMEGLLRVTDFGRRAGVDIRKKEDEVNRLYA